MSEQMTKETAHVIVVVRMAADLHHLLGRVAASLALVTGCLFFAGCVDFARQDWFSATLTTFATFGFAVATRDTWTRRRKYARFASLPATTDEETR